ncbi:hypothetical protein T09_10169, partial [Trichinella sp. T9]
LYQNLILRVKKGTVETTVDKMEYGSFVYRCSMARKKASTPCVMQLFQLVRYLSTRNLFYMDKFATYKGFKASPAKKRLHFS